MDANLKSPAAGSDRIVIIGGGFAGINLVKKLRNSVYQVVMLDKNNYHTFQPLLYQVATGGLEPDSIAYPLRKIFHGYKNFSFRVAAVSNIDTVLKQVETDVGLISYDHLVIATGSGNNFFNLGGMSRYAMPLKSITEALDLRSLILQNMESALVAPEIEREKYFNIVIVGGGPTGVELAGAITELKKHVLPNDYPEINLERMQIYLIEASERLLAGLTVSASEGAYKTLTGMGVNVMLNTRVQDYDGDLVKYGADKQLKSKTVIWSAGVQGEIVNGLGQEVLKRGNRYDVDAYHRINGYENVFAIGDVALMSTENYPTGHPMVAQVAIQQARNLGQNFLRQRSGKSETAFKYKDLGSMATIGRNKAVADLPGFSTRGRFAWLIWMFIHLMNLVGFRNRVVVFINWLWNYISYDRAIRLVIRPFKRNTH